MKHLQTFIYESLIMEAPNEIKTVVNGIHSFNKETTDEEIIDTILHDFCHKCCVLIKECYAPNCSLTSLCTYDLFYNRWGDDNPGDVSAGPDANKIYSEIPSDLCSDLILNELQETEGYEVLTKEEIKSMFSSGEFPLIVIWKGYHEGLEEIHVTYYITR